jgi:DNA-binding IclR family transcriptional regulator
MPAQDKARNSTAANALEILDLFSAARRRVTALEVAHHLGTSRSTAYRYLDTLVDRGYLATDDDGGFRIGRRIQELALLDHEADRALAMANTWLSRLREEFDETVVYTVRTSGVHTVVRSSLTGGQVLTANYPVGAVMPLHAGAPSTVLLASATDEQIAVELQGADLEPFTPTTPVTLESILRIVRQVREHGYAVSRGELNPELVSVGAPIHGAGRHGVIAGLGLVVPASRCTPELEHRMAGRLVEAAADISSRLAGL